MFEKRVIVNVSQSEILSYVEVRTGTVAVEIVGVDKSSVVVIGRVVDGVTVSVCRIQFQAADVVAQRGLQCVVIRRSGLVLALNVANTGVGSERVRAIAAGNKQIDRCTGCDTTRRSRSNVGNRGPVRRCRIGRYAISARSVDAVA